MQTRLIIALALLLASLSCAEAQKSNSSLLFEIGSNFPDNTTGAITPLAARSFLTDFVNSQNVSGTTCLSGMFTQFQPFANTSTTPNVSLTFWDGTQCVPWATLNTSTHTFSVSAGALNIISSTTPIPVNSFGVGNNAVASNLLENIDNSALTGTERHTLWIGAESQGTGDGSIIGATYALVLSALKTNYLTTTIPGQFGSLVLVARGGVQGAGASCPAASIVVGCGDTATLQWNVIQSALASAAIGQEGVVTYSTDGTTTCAGCVSIRNAVSLIRKDQSLAYGYTTQAVNGAAGIAYFATNSRTGVTNPGTWTAFAQLTVDDGTHTPYAAFQVNQAGQVILAGFGTAGTNQKTLRVGSAVTNNLEIVNAAASAVIESLTDTGVLNAVGGYVGTATNDNAPAGNIGEYISSAVASGAAVALTSGTAANLTSVSLTGGDWDVVCQLVFTGAIATTVSNFLVSLGTTSATITTTPGQFTQTPEFGQTVFAGGGLVTQWVGPVRFSEPSTGSAFCVALANFAGGTTSVYGFLRARRVR